MSLHSLQISDGPAGPVFVLAGEIDLSVTADLRKRIEAALQPPPEVAVLDLRAVDFLDSSGLRLLLDADRAQRVAGKRLIVVRGGRRVARVLELSGAERVLELVDDPAEPAP